MALIGWTFTYALLVCSWIRARSFSNCGQHVAPTAPLYLGIDYDLFGENFICTWNIEVAPDQVIHLTDDSYPWYTDCLNNSISVYDGYTTIASSLIGRFCIDDRIDIISTNNVMTVQLTVQYYDFFDFRAHYDSINATSGCPFLSTTFPLVVGYITHWDTGTANRTANFWCNSTYILEGPQTLVCQENDTWSHATPTCIYLGCELINTTSPLKVSYLTTSYKAATFGTAQFSCDGPYILDGQRTLVCMDNKTWSLPDEPDTGSFSSEPAICIELDCELINTTSPLKVSYLTTSYKATTFGTAQFSCDGPYILDGQRTLVCMDNKTWSLPYEPDTWSFSSEPAICIDFAFPRLDNSFLRPRILLKDGPGANHGRVELLDGPRNYSFCQLGFSENVARVICSYLGYSLLESLEFNSHFGPSKNRLLPVQLECNGSESNLGECQQTGLDNQCDESMEVSVKCRVGETRLIHPYVYSDEGHVVVYHFGRWNYLTYNVNIATTVCRLLGFRNGMPAMYGRNTMPLDHYVTGLDTCAPNATSVFECLSSTGFYIRTYGQIDWIYSSIYCHSGEITRTRLRLGLAPYSGFLELELAGRWRSARTPIVETSNIWSACNSTLEEKPYANYTIRKKLDNIPSWTVNLPGDNWIVDNLPPSQTDAFYVHCNKAMPVEVLTPPINGNINYTTYSNGEVHADIKCDDAKYRLEGQSKLVFSGGSWNSTETDVCQLVDCGQPSPTLFGYVSFSQSFGLYVCNPGYHRIQGDAAIECLVNGHWSGQPFECGLPVLSFLSMDAAATKWTTFDDDCKLVELSQDIPVFEIRHNKIYVCANGIVTLGSPYYNPVPEREPLAYGNRTILAPYYADIVPGDNGIITYTVKDTLNTEQISSLDVAPILSVFGEEFLGSSFDPTVVLLVRWENVSHFDQDSYGLLSTSFELTLISDGKNTFVGYAYKIDAMNWNTSLESPDIWIGLYAGSDHVETFPYSFGPKVLRPDINMGIDERKGRQLYRLTSPDQQTNSVDADTMSCKKWYLSEKKLLEQRSASSGSMPDCPCTIRWLQTDPWFNPRPTTSGNITCFDIWPLHSILPFGKSCCYNTSTSVWLGEQPFAGSFHLYHPSIYPREHKINDVTPRHHCCASVATCDLFYKLRPVGNCYRQSWFRFGTLWGDPHFQTLDGQNFTFNGLGEYTLLNISKGNNTFELQARTILAKNKDGKNINATVFGAFAARDLAGASIHVELSKDRHSIIFYANGEDLSLSYNKATPAMPFVGVSNGNLVRTRLQDTLRVTFSSCRVSLNISLNAGMLSVNVFVPEQYHGKTIGLLGNFDGIKANDFQAPNGTVFPSNMSEREIFFYGNLWEVVHPAFQYPENSGHTDYHFADFTPPFLDEADPAIVEKAIAKCGDKSAIPCVFDYVFTQDADVAIATQNIADSANETTVELENVIPTVQACGTQNITIGKMVTCPIKVNVSSNTVVTFVDNGIGAIFNQSSRQLTFVQTSDEPTSLSVAVVTDSGVMSPAVTLDFLFCTGCNNHGQCTFTPRRDPRETAYFRYSQCHCDTGYDGADCELDYDGCANVPCSHHRKCVDLSPLEENLSGNKFQCEGCLQGYKTENDKCIDIDECRVGVAKCHHICTNTDGSYICSCFSGYTEDSDHPEQCIDIDECTTDHGCKQVCENTPGSYNCNCFGGYRFDPTVGCILVFDACDNHDHDLNCNNTAGCRVNNNIPECFCENGYQLTDNNTSCEDVDECRLGACSHRCNNFPGGYNCGCHDGFQLTDSIRCQPCPFPTWGPNCTNICTCSERGVNSCHHIKGCRCNRGWSGASCNDDVDECENDVCSDIKKQCVNHQGSYSCVCKTGFEENASGMCKDIDECADILLHTCEQTCVNEPGGYSCQCHSGYTLANSTHCQDIDECMQDISGCDHLCENYLGGFNCFCRYGYYLLADRRTCEKYLNPCQSYANLTCSHYCVLEDHSATCRCKIGYKLATDKQTCLDIDECSAGLHRCSPISTCKNTPGTYTCVCPDGFRLENDGRTCTECNLYHYGPNCSLTCACVNGYCDKLQGCICEEGWTGDQCDLDIDECASNSGLCPGLNRVCVNTVGGYACHCQKGYMISNGSCVDTNECSSLDTNTCDQVCVNTAGSYECQCHNGFQWNGAQCTDTDECTGPSPPCDQVCQNSLGGFSCSCHKGFTLNLLDRRTCQPIALCRPSKAKECMGKKAQCVIIDHIEVCLCYRGFDMKGGMCQDVQECMQSPCSHTCEELPGSFKCTCPIGYHLDASNTICTECSNWTYGENCDHRCNCDQYNTRSCDSKNGTCYCNSGWRGDNCTDDINECMSTSMGPGLQCPVESTCINTRGSFVCKCNPGYIKTSDSRCQACQSNRFGDGCSRNCSCKTENTIRCDHVTGRCLCKEGWESGTCDHDINECHSKSMCGGHETCVNTPGSYICMCKTEHLSADGHCIDCEKCEDDDDCDPDLCRPSDDKLQLKDQLIMYGGVGGGALVLIIVMAIGISCLRRRTNKKKSRPDRSDRPRRRRRHKKTDFDSPCQDVLPH